MNRSNLKVGGMAAFRGGDGQGHCARSGQSVSLRISFAPRKMMVPLKNIAGAHRRLTQRILQVGAHGQTVCLHVNAAGDVAALMQELPGINGQCLLGKQVAGIGDARRGCRLPPPITAPSPVRRSVVRRYLRHPPFAGRRPFAPRSPARRYPVAAPQLLWRQGTPGTRWKSRATLLPLFISC